MPVFSLTPVWSTSYIHFKATKENKNSETSNWNKQKSIYIEQWPIFGLAPVWSTSYIHFKAIYCSLISPFMRNDNR